MRYMVIVNVDKVINCNLFWPLKCFAMQMQQTRAGQRGVGVLYRVVQLPNCCGALKMNDILTIDGRARGKKSIT